MSETYFLGREQDGDEDGVYPESVYDGHIWSVDPTLPDDPERGPNGPEIAASIPNERQAEWVLSVIQERDRLRGMLRELLEAADEVRAGLDQRIEFAPDDAKPVFRGIAALYTAIAKGRGA